MCMLCPDFVDDCREAECRGQHLFFLGDTFCTHLTNKWGTDSPSLAFHVSMDHDLETLGRDSTACEDNCIENGWYSRDEIRNVVLAIRRQYKLNG